MEINDMLSYTIDSPFFTSKIDSFTFNTEKLTDFIKYLIRHMRHLCKDIKQCSKTAETLGIYMKNNIKIIPNMSTILPIIQQLGEFFTEYANSNEILASSLESSFSEPLELFHLREVSSTLSMIQLYRNLKETGENSILRYLQSDVANFGRGLTQHQIEQRAYDIVQHKRRFEIVRFDLIQKINDVEVFKNYEFIDSCASSVLSLQTHFRICQDKLDSFQSKLLHFQQELHKEKTSYLEEGKPLIRKRRDLTNVLDAMVERVEIASPYLTGAVAITEGTTSTHNNNNNSNNNNNNTTDNKNSPNLNDEENGISSSNYNNFSNSNSTSTNNNNSNNNTPNSNSSGSSSWQSISRIGVSWGASLIGNLAKQSQQIIGSNQTTNDMSNHSHHTPNYDGKSRRSQIDDQSVLSPTSSNVTYGATCEECEARMKALDSSELVPLYQPSPYGELRIPGVIKQGFLWKRNEKSKLIEQWKRLWFVLDETKLYYIITDPHDADSYHTQTVCDLMLASVRERKGETDLPFSFEVAFANFESTVVQAEGQKEYKSWITELRNTIANRLTSGEPALVIAKKTKQKHSTVSLTNFSNENSNNNNNSPGSEISENRRKNAEHVLELFQNNLYCAECERESPEWISLNLGCLVCIDCSGVHRSLGVHISKMRSLKLDDLEVEEYLALKEAGNNLSNSIWEALVPPSFKKPDCNSSYSEREKFIRAKYEQRLFLNPPFNENLSIKELFQWKETLLKSCESNNYYDLLNSIAHDMNLHLSFNYQNNQFNQIEQIEQNNGNINSNNNNHNINNIINNNNRKYPLHIAIKHGSLTSVYFLIMNGFDIFLRDENGLSSIEIAEKYQKSEIVSYLRKRSELVNKVIHQSPIKQPQPQQLFTEEQNENEDQKQDNEQRISEVEHEENNNNNNNNNTIDIENNIDKVPSLGIHADDPFYDEDLKMI